MRATAIAQPNIALIKYWGKRDSERNLPAVGSISITLAELYTRMRVAVDASLDDDVLLVNGSEDPSMLPRVQHCLDLVGGSDRLRVEVQSESNFPIAAGLASSASAFAALVVAANNAFGRLLTRPELARLAGHASGSAARSLYGGFVELDLGDEDIDVRPLLDEENWPLTVVVAITQTQRKAVSSTRAMELSRTSSPFYGRWLEQQPADLDEARSAIVAKDLARLGAIAEHNCLKMHSVMWGSRPPMIFWNSATLNAMQTVRDLQADGVGVFFTIDAGPQLKAICLPGDGDRVAAALAATPGVIRVMQSGLGPGARLAADD